MLIIDMPMPKYCADCPMIALSDRGMICLCTEIENCGYYGKKYFCQNALLNDAADALEAAEKRIAELMPKDGEWIDEQRGRWIYAKCNLCGKVQDVRSNYCPNCGAKMKGANDEAD